MINYVKLSLVFGCLALLLALLMEYLRFREGLSNGLSWNILSDAAFNFGTYCIIAFILLAFHRAKVRSIVSNPSESDFSVRQARTLLLHLSFEKAFATCKESLSVIDKYWLIEENLDEGRILIRTKPTLLEWWRDTVTFTLSKVGEKLTEVKIESHPTGRTPLVDNGKNLRRIEKLADFLQQKEEPLKLPETKENLEDLFGGLSKREKTAVK